SDTSGEGRYDDLVEDGYSYYNSADPIGGGLGGGPIDGQINVTVLDIMTLLPVEGAFVMLGTDGDTTYQGLTNPVGQIVFVGDDLSGRQQLSAGKENYESTTFVQFDARDVTIFLIPIPDPTPGPLPPGRYAATISGILVFDGPNEFEANPWEIIPDPVDPDEVKACYVATTQSDYFRENPPAGTASRVVEIDPMYPGVRNYEYQIIARPAALAVWAICGLENERTEVFIPYAMGVRRSVLAGPAELVEDQDIRVDIPLDHLTEVEFEDTPLERESGPDRYMAEAYIDLGGEGVIARDDRFVTSFDPARTFRMVAQPPLTGTIEDAQWLFMGGAYTGSEYSNPFSVVLERGV
ncbi:MAG: hypothetical protein L0206_21705, partial [Actinobacteria bacterium]|nr:hypothetical protein [Actinomycetota bacterium]